MIPLNRLQLLLKKKKRTKSNVGNLQGYNMLTSGYIIDTRKKVRDHGFEIKASRDLGSSTGGLHVKFWQTRAITLSGAKLFLAISAVFPFVCSQNFISSSSVGSM